MKISAFGLLLLGVVAFCFSAFEAITVREQISRMTNELHEVRQTNAELHDKNRSLLLEYYTLTDYDKIHALAKKLGMRVPSVADGSYVHLLVEETQ